MKEKRRYPIGAEVIAPRITHFRVWAPKVKTLEVALEGGDAHALAAEQGGYFSGAIPCGAGARYRLRVNGGDAFPDPASRFQPEGPHGPSCVVDPFAFRWTDAEWRGVKLAGQIIYEFHVGTFTPEGTWRTAIRKLPALKESGITLLEMMPVADFPGRFGWGYDGVNLFAPTRLYGAPDDLRAFVDAAHALGLGVILDVVYNHFGPDGNYLAQFSADYMHRERKNEWGDVINFHCEPVREFFITNGRYWIDEFHFDGYRFDATHGIIDQTDAHIIGEIGQAARAAAGKREIVLMAENEFQEAKMVRPRSAGGDDLDGMWNDDWHHAALVALTGNREGYYRDYRGVPQEFISAAKYGYLYQGQPTLWHSRARGEPTFGTSAEAFVSFLENHDQIANGATGQRARLLTSTGRYRAMTALLLLGPWTPLLFQGEEFGASSPFHYFCDLGDEKLRAAIRKGRSDLVAIFIPASEPAAPPPLPDPADALTFERCKLNWSERSSGNPLFALHRDLITLRREDGCFGRHARIDGAVLGERAFVFRYIAEQVENERLLLINLGEQTELKPLSEPLLAPLPGLPWETLWSSESEKYGGSGASEVMHEASCIIPAESAVVLRPVITKRRR